MARPRRGVCNWTFIGPRNVGGRATAIAVDPTNPDTVFLGTAGGGVWKTTDAGKSWEPLFDYEISLSIGAVAVAPSNRLRVYVGTGEVNGNYDEVPGSGVYRSDDGGDTWRRIATPAQTSARISAIWVHPSNPDLVLVASPGDTASRAGIWRTTNGGVRWEATRLLPLDVPEGLPVDPSAGTAITTGVWDLAGRFDAGNENVVYCAQGGITNLVRRSTDFGATWRELIPGLSTPGTPPFWADRVAIAICDSSPQRIYARAPLQRGSGMTREARGVIWRSDDGGATWSSPVDDTAGYMGGFANTIATKGDNPNVVYGGAFGVVRSADGGAMFAPPGGTGVPWGAERYSGPVDLHPDIHALKLAPRTRPTRVYCAGDGGLYVSHFGEPGQTDGATWVKRNHGLNATQFSHVGIAHSAPSMLGGGTQDNGTPRRISGLTWRIVYGGDGGIFEVNPRDASECYYQYLTGDLRRSVDGGRTESSFNRGLSISSEDTGWLEVPFAFDPSDPATKYTGTSRVYRSVGSADWSPVSNVLTEMPGDMMWNPLAAVTVDPTNRNVLWAGSMRGRVFRASSPTAASWEERTGSWPRRGVSTVRVHPANGNEVYVAVSGWAASERVFFGDGTVGGWRDISATLVQCSVAELVIDPWDTTRQTLYVGTELGVFRTTDRGRSWILLDAGLPNSPIWGMSLDQSAGLLRVATHGRGMWELEVGPGTRCSDFQLYVRSSPLDMGRGVTPSNVPDPVRPRERVHWWESPDIKVDAEPYQTWRHVAASGRTEEVTRLDGVLFDAELVHNFPRRGRRARVYVQVHNRGPFSLRNVRVRAFYANATGALPPVPDGFWDGFADWGATAGAWTAVGPAQDVPELRPALPQVRMFEWDVPATQPEHSCLLVLTTSGDDPLRATGTLVGPVVPNNRHVALRNVHVVDFGTIGSPSDTDPALLTSDLAPSPRVIELALHNPFEHEAAFELLLERPEGVPMNAGIVFPEGLAGQLAGADVEEHGLDLVALWEEEAAALQEARAVAAEEGTSDEEREKEDLAARKKFFSSLDPLVWMRAEKPETAIDGLVIPPLDVVRVGVVVGPREGAELGVDQHLRVIQTLKGEIVGGSTFEIRTGPARVALPSRRTMVVELVHLEFHSLEPPCRFLVEALVGRQRGHEPIRKLVPGEDESPVEASEGAFENVVICTMQALDESGLDLRVQPVSWSENESAAPPTEDSKDSPHETFANLGRLILEGPVSEWERESVHKIAGDTWHALVRVSVDP